MVARVDPSTPKSHEGHHALVVGSLDPDHAVLELHFQGDVEEPVDVFAEFRGDTVDGPDVGDLVDVHGQAALS